MARTGESHAVFVVQRSFRRVRRGYDPDEVDRHLQHVSEWFTKTHAGESARQWEAQLRERERAVEEGRRRLAGEQVEAAATLAEAEQVVAAARQEAAAILDQARLDAAAAERAHPVLAEAHAEAERIRAEVAEFRERELATARTAAE